MPVTAPEDSRKREKRLSREERYRREDRARKGCKRGGQGKEGGEGKGVGEGRKKTITESKKSRCAGNRVKHRSNEEDVCIERTPTTCISRSHVVHCYSV